MIVSIKKNPDIFIALSSKFKNLSFHLLSNYHYILLSIKLRCNDYGYECDLVLDEELTIGLIKKLRDHFEEEHGLDYTMGAVTQMITNRGHSLESIKKE